MICELKPYGIPDDFHERMYAAERKGSADEMSSIIIQTLDKMPKTKEAIEVEQRYMEENMDRILQEIEEANAEYDKFLRGELELLFEGNINILKVDGIYVAEIFDKNYELLGQYEITDPEQISDLFEKEDE